MSGMKFVMKSDKDVWQTPWKDFLEEIDARLPGGITGDPCAGEGTSHGRQYNYRLEDGQNGLDLPWKGRNWFMNPPFTLELKKEFLDKAVREFQSGNAHFVIVLTPDSTDTKSWWHEYIAPNCRYTWFKYGRLEFIDPMDETDDNSGVSFGTALSFLGPVPPRLKRWLRKNGDLVRRPGVSYRRTESRTLDEFSEQ